MITEIQNSAENKMQKSVDALGHELTKIRTGRASPGLIEHIKISYYGTDTPLNQVANISVSDARTLMITPWEKTQIPVIEKAIHTSDLGLNPTVSGNAIRIPLPPLTEERRKELVRLVRTEGENARVAIRNIRRDAINQFKEILKKKEISEDEERRAEESMQKLTDKYIANAEKVLQDKEHELMEL